jgi:sigma-B regulation protein RsbU (phosphoserine phosphatase)
LLGRHRCLPDQGTLLIEDTDSGTLSPAEQHLLDSAACGLLQTAADGTILRANRVFCTWVGHSADALVGKRRFQELLTVGGRIFHQTHWAPLLQMQGSISEVKLELVHRDGSTIPMVLNALERVHQGSRVHELAAFIARDRDKYERELVLSRKRLEQLVAEGKRLQEEAKDRAVFAEQMIGIVSHDLRNPLSTILMGCVLLARGELSASQQRTLNRITRSTERANRLIADLLDFTQARLGKGLPVSLAPIDLHESVAESVEELALAYPGRILRHLRSGEGPCVADGNRLAQLIGNLVSNAMVYGATGEPVTVRSAVEPEAFFVSVHNHGSPIPIEAQESLFQPMTRATTASSPSRSVGLGLYIVNEIAKAHGGRAFVQSSVEEGTTFTAALPMTVLR